MDLQGWQDTDLPVVRALYIVGVGLLAVSTIPTLSIKHASIPRSFLPLAIVVAMVLVMCLTVFPWPTLIAASIVYLASLPLCYMAQARPARA